MIMTIIDQKEKEMTAVIDVNDLTKDQLLERAKAMGVKGRHDMTKDELWQAVFGEPLVSEDDDEEDEDDDNEDLGDEPVGEFITKDQLVSIKRRKPSTARRDAAGKVVRSGVNLSGNLPFKHKYYALKEEFADLEAAPAAYREAIAAAPQQVQLLLKFMRAEGYVEGQGAGIGGEIAGLAISKGYLKTKIAPANLFAYYRRVMEALGLVEVTEFEGD